MSPTATYRIQFHSGFRFADGRDLVPYLNELGITHLYSSPRFKARRGSSHGYDVVDPSQINSELGTEQDFNELAEKLANYDMGLVLDIVPNHMAAVAENPWWRDVLENGPASEFANWFDIDWHPSMFKAQFLQDNRVLLPILGDLYGHVLKKQEFTLKIEDTGFYVRYYEHKLPLEPKSCSLILEHSGVFPELVEELAALPPFTETDPEQIAIRRREAPRIIERIWSGYRDTPEVKQAIDEWLRALSSSSDALDEILSRQAYRMAYWKIGYEEINYRRFFDINTLVGMRIELPEVFAARHAALKTLVEEGKVTGVRVDHVDGLYDPLEYLRRMQDIVPGRKPYIIVEKVLGRNEELPRDWPVAGTTGYDFMNAVNGVHIDLEGLAALETAYAERVGAAQPFAELCYASNKLVMQRLFAGEVNRFSHQLGRLAARERDARDISLAEMTDAFIEVTACLPIYRTYIRDFEIPERDRGYLERTLKEARRRTPEDRVSDSAFDFIHRVLLLDPPYYAQDQKAEYLRFVMRWQQFTGPVMGKGLEDTAFYVHNSLISRNEVGGDPLRELPPMDLGRFHCFNRRRLAAWPASLNATSTHDSKRSEDARARINVLSELPREWESCLDVWLRLHPPPDISMAILIYQSLLGVWPRDTAEIPELTERMKTFAIKAAREAKVHSGWVAPDEEYESALQSYIETLLNSADFLNSFAPLQQKTAFHGAFNALSQVLLKIASPGVPDFYQGCEFWNFSLVDPDNRRPVDYAARTTLLESLRRREADDRCDMIADLVDNWPDDGIKLYLTYKALEFRRAHRELFQDGEYLPLEAEGARAAHICAFARHEGSHWALAVTPRLTVGLDCRPPDMRSAQWEDTTLLAPPAAPHHWTNVLTGEEGESLRLAHLLHAFPVALLHGEQ